MIGSHRRTLKRQATKVMFGEYREKVAREIAEAIEKPLGAFTMAPPQNGERAPKILPGWAAELILQARADQARDDAAMARRIGKWRD